MSKSFRNWDANAVKFAQEKINMNKSAREVDIPKPEKHSKFFNKKTVYDGIKFDSKKEMNRFKELKLMEAAGEIKNLMLQQEFQFIIGGILVCTYRCDFLYFERDKELQWVEVVEDVKSNFTRKNPVYRIKKKLLLALFNHEIREI